MALIPAPSGLSFWLGEDVVITSGLDTAGARLKLRSPDGRLVRGASEQAAIVKEKSAKAERRVRGEESRGMASGNPAFNILLVSSQGSGLRNLGPESKSTINSTINPAVLAVQQSRHIWLAKICLASDFVNKYFVSKYFIEFNMKLRLIQDGA